MASTHRACCCHQTVVVRRPPPEYRYPGYEMLLVVDTEPLTEDIVYKFIFYTGTSTLDPETYECVECSFPLDDTPKHTYVNYVSQIDDVDGDIIDEVPFVVRDPFWSLGYYFERDFHTLDDSRTIKFVVQFGSPANFDVSFEVEPLPYPTFGQNVIELTPSEVGYVGSMHKGVRFIEYEIVVGDDSHAARQKAVVFTEYHVSDPLPYDYAGVVRSIDWENKSLEQSGLLHNRPVTRHPKFAGPRPFEEATFYPIQIWVPPVDYPLGGTYFNSWWSIPPGPFPSDVVDVITNGIHYAQWEYNERLIRDNPCSTGYRYWYDSGVSSINWKWPPCDPVQFYADLTNIGISHLYEDLPEDQWKSVSRKSKLANYSVVVPFENLTELNHIMNDGDWYVQQ